MRGTRQHRFFATISWAHSLIWAQQDTENGVLDTDPVPDPVVHLKLPLIVYRHVLLHWTQTPLMIVIAISASSCASGMSIWLYIIPLVQIIYSIFTEAMLMKELAAAIEGMSASFTYNASWVPKMFGRSLAVTRPKMTRSLTVLDHRYILMLIGFNSALDLATDAIQIGQVRQCDLVDKDFNDQYAESWSYVGMVQFAKAIHLWGFFLMLLITAFFVQGVVGIVTARRALSMVRPGMPAAGNFPDLCVRSERCRQKLVAKRLLFSRLALASECASMLYASRVLLELAAEMDGFLAATKPPEATQSIGTGGTVEPPIRAVRGRKLARERKQKTEAEQRFDHYYLSVVRLVLFESVPSLSLTVAFFSLELDNLDGIGVAKNIFSMLSSAVYATMMAFYVAGGGIKGKLLAFFIVVCVLMAVAKIAPAFVCDSNFYSVVTFRCVEKV
eukprot:NODE_6326_length_1682_cov_7.412219.p1 GENE.NODE_6326_length_1682_cov_7.412219~~NODE_6326_length_1682_cov_7.412219.p1  ORF type:complete len:444 (+),score=125.28 NODE_6326_length_1682_cov_7.412219:106-1437(+)